MGNWDKFNRDLERTRKIAASEVYANLRIVADAVGCTRDALLHDILDLHAQLTPAQLAIDEEVVAAERAEEDEE